MSGDVEQTWTPNQVVAFNLRRAREERGWTQDELGRQLAPYLGAPWSKALVSQAERSVDGVRIRPFDADELVAFARALELPIAYFFMPPDGERLMGQADPMGAAKVITWLLGGILDHSQSAVELDKRLIGLGVAGRRELRAKLREASANALQGRVGDLRVVLERMMPAVDNLLEATSIVSELLAATGDARAQEAQKMLAQAEAEAKAKEGSDGPG